MHKRVFIWGTGNVAKRYIDTKEVDDEALLGFIESHKTKNNFLGKKVYEPHEIRDEYDYIIVCVYGKTHAIYQTALENNIMPQKLVFVDNWEWIDGTSMISDYPKHLCRPINSFSKCEEIKEIFPVLHERFICVYDMMAERYMAVQENGYEWTHKDSVLEDDRFNKKEYWSDYFRYRSFELMVNEIRKNNIEGAVAELGVFRGKFSKLINIKFPERTLYLFDSFDSFDIQEYVREVGAGKDHFYEIFKNTNEELVLNGMTYPENCIIRKGIFPKTAVGLENESYAFVSIDVDLKQSILAGLQYFYPRLNRGGSIFLHDYNNYFLEGVKAVSYTHLRAHETSV